MEEMSVLIAKSQSGDKKAREILIEKNLGLVHHIAKRFYGRGVEVEDLFQIGTIGLIKAIDRFDLSLGLKFSTYAVPLITGEIKRFLRDDGMVKVSRSIKENALKVRVARARLCTELNREPVLSEIAKLSGLSEEEIITAIDADTTVESLYSFVYQDDGSEVYLVDKIVQGEGKFVGNQEFYENDIEKEKVLNRLLLSELLSHLNEQEKKLINMRYFEEKTQTQTAKDLGISQVQVSRLEKKILLRLREHYGKI